MKHSSKKKPGLIIVLSAPSGCGKTTVTDGLLKKMPSLKRSISATTRPRRKGEQDTQDYFFLTEKEFRAKKKYGHFLESAKVFEHYYGTPRHYVEQAVNAGVDIILTIDIQGARQIRRTIKEGVFIFLLPPSLRELKARLFKRKTDTQHDIRVRLNETKNELQEAFQYDYVVVNDAANQAVEDIMHIIQAERQKVIRNKEVIRGIYSA